MFSGLEDDDQASGGSVGGLMRGVDLATGFSQDVYDCVVFRAVPVQVYFLGVFPSLAVRINRFEDVFAFDRHVALRRSGWKNGVSGCLEKIARERSEISERGSWVSRVSWV